MHQPQIINTGITKEEVSKMIDSSIRTLNLEHLLAEHDPAAAQGTGTFAIARVVARNDPENKGRVAIYPIENQTNSLSTLEGGDIENQCFFAEVLSVAKGENHGVWVAPEFGDFVVYTILADTYLIIGSISNLSRKFPAVNIPVEAQSFQANSKEYNTSNWPNLTKKGYHLEDPKIGTMHQPASYLQRWRKNDFLIYNTTKINSQAESAAKLMELRSSENQMLQLVDLGNNHIKPGLEGEDNTKKYSPVRQTDYRDLWEGFNINKEFWTERSDKPPVAHESQFVKLATNGHDYSEVTHGDGNSDLPELLRGEFRFDDRTAFGSHETAKTYCPVYQTLKMEEGDERYFQDKPKKGDWDTGAPYRNKVKMWIEDTEGMDHEPEVQHFNVGHYLTLSNTIFKRRAMLSTKKGHQLVMSDIDKDEKLLMNSYRGKHVYMEDSDPEHYDAMWFASQKHHLLFVDNMVSPHLIDDKGVERHRLVDPNQKDGSTYQLLQTEAYQKIWLADSPDCPRIHAHTTTGHELLLLDHDKGISNISPTPNQGKIQITTNDKQMQITMDVESGDITIQNHNLGGTGAGGKPLTGDISIYAANNLLLHADNMIQMRANMGYDIQTSSGSYNVVACGISHSTPCGAPTIPEIIRPTVLTDIDVTEGALINKFDPS